MSQSTSRREFIVSIGIMRRFISTMTPQINAPSGRSAGGSLLYLIFILLLRSKSQRAINPRRRLGLL